MLTEAQKQDLDTWDSLARRPPWPFVTRKMSAEEWVYLEAVREEREGKIRTAAKPRYSGPARPG